MLGRFSKNVHVKSIRDLFFAWFVGDIFLAGRINGEKQETRRKRKKKTLL